MRKSHVHAVVLLVFSLASSVWADLTAASSVDDVLDALDACGKNLTSFTADLKLIETDAATGDATDRTGKVWFSQPKDAPPSIRVTFDKKEANGKITEDKIEYLLAGPDLIDRTYRNKTQVTRHVLKPGQKMDLFRLGEGPFPLPIGQSKEDVHAAFDVRKTDATKDDPANTVHIQLAPKPDTRLARRFKTIDVWVDLQDHFPRKIETLDRNESATKGTEMTNVKLNAPIAASDFVLPKVSEGEWQLIEEAYND